MRVVPSTAAAAPPLLMVPPPLPPGEWNKMLPFSRFRLRPSGSNEKTVFAPTRVMVWSGAVSSVRESGPVRTRSGVLNSSFTFAGVAAWVDGTTTFTSWITSVNVLWVSEPAKTARPPQTANPARRILVFMFAPG